MEADLLTEKQLRELMSCRELSNAVSYLKKSVYGLFLPEAESESMGYIIDEAIRYALSDSVNKLATIAKGEDDKFIEILLGRWDVYNIKTLIRGKLNNIPSFEVLNAAIPAGIAAFNTSKEGILFNLPLISVFILYTSHRPRRISMNLSSSPFAIVASLFTESDRAYRMASSIM